MSLKKFTFLAFFLALDVFIFFNHRTFSSDELLPDPCSLEKRLEAVKAGLQALLQDGLFFDEGHAQQFERGYQLLHPNDKIKNSTDARNLYWRSLTLFREFKINDARLPVPHEFDNSTFFKNLIIRTKINGYHWTEFKLYGAISTLRPPEMVALSTQIKAINEEAIIEYLAYETTQKRNMQLVTKTVEDFAKPKLEALADHLANYFRVKVEETARQQYPEFTRGLAASRGASASGTATQGGRNQAAQLNQLYQRSLKILPIYPEPPGKAGYTLPSEQVGYIEMAMGFSINRVLGYIANADITNWPQYPQFIQKFKNCGVDVQCNLTLGKELKALLTLNSHAKPPSSG